MTANRLDVSSNAPNFSYTEYFSWERPLDNAWIIESVEGLDAVPSDINVVELATRAGGYWANARTPTRNIVIHLLFNRAMRYNPYQWDWDYNKAWSRTFPSYNRRTIVDTFSPGHRVNLLFDREDAQLGIDGVTESCDFTRFEEDLRCTVSILCPFPYFRTVLPTKFDIENGPNYAMLNYRGQVPAYPELRMYTQGGFGVRSPIFQMYILDAQEDRHFVINSDGFAGGFIGIPNGAQFFVTTQPGDRSVYYQEPGYERMNVMSGVEFYPASNWPVLMPGVNYVAIGARTNAQLMRCEITYHPLWEAI